MRQLKIKPIEERFWSKVLITSPWGCWLWTGAVAYFGYGKFSESRTGDTITAHRFSWGLHKGPVPEGICVLHRCDNPPCVNPNHLFLGTLTDNSVDMTKKGRGVGRLTASQATLIRARLLVGEDINLVAKEFSISPTHAANIKCGARWGWTR